MDIVEFLIQELVNNENLDEEDAKLRTLNEVQNIINSYVKRYEIFSRKHGIYSQCGLSKYYGTLYKILSNEENLLIYKSRLVNQIGEILLSFSIYSRSKVAMVDGECL
jgi:hypothetical protein